ncbi:MAG: homocysteine S-methyltransferase family protein [Christensenella sp.]
MSLQCENKVLVYDGSKGVMLQLKGLTGGESAEEWNLTNSDKVCEVYNEYIAAGADIIQTNTFCANEPSLLKHGLADKLYEINYEGARLALECVRGKDVMVAASVGPTGLFFQPAGDMTFDMATELFKMQLKPLKDAGITIVNFETFTDLNEMRAAMTAARELGIPDIIASMTFDNGRTMSGNTPEVCAVVCKALGAEIVGANCSGGPESLIEPISCMNAAVGTPISVKPNAGLPEMESGVAVFKQKPEDFARLAQEFIKNGVRLIGGCCGSGPNHIKALRTAVNAAIITEVKIVPQEMLASAYEAVAVEGMSTTKMNVCTKSVIEGMQDGDYYCLMDEIPQDAQDVDAVIVDFGDMGLTFDMWSFVSTLGMFIKKPVIVAAENAETAQAFLRCYAGRAGVRARGVNELYGAIEL